MRKYKLAAFQILLLISVQQVGCVSKIPHQNQNAQNENKPQATTQASSTDSFPLEDKIKTIVAKELNIKPETVDVNAPLSKQKVAVDDLDVVEIIMTIEETFDIEIRDEEISNSGEELAKNLTVKKLTDIVSKKKKL